jgi:hypothetical protein
MRLICQQAGFVDDVSFLQKSPWLLMNDAFLKLKPDRQRHGSATATIKHLQLPLRK